MDRRGFIGALTTLAGVVMPKITCAQVATQRSPSPAFSAACTGITHVFMGPTGPVDHRLLGNLHGSFEYRGQSLMSPASLTWMRRHYGIRNMPILERDKYVVPDDYIYHGGFFDIERARAVYRAENIEAGRDPEYGLDWLK